MAGEYDMLEREDRGSAFLMGLLAGTVLGAGLGLLFAPKAGRELRTQLNDASDRLQRSATEGYHTASEKVSRIVERGRGTYDRARDAVGRGGAEGPRRASEMAEEAREGISSAMGEAQSGTTRMP